MMRIGLSRIKFAGLILAAPLAVLAGCSSQGSAETQAAVQPSANVHPVSGLEIIPLTVSGVGGTHEFMVEVADTPQAQAAGLMFRIELGPQEGMIFPRSNPEQASFWMKNTPLPLDIIFVGTDGLISNIAAQTTPYSLDSVSSVGLVSGVLEIPGGRAEELGITAGDKVEW